MSSSRKLDRRSIDDGVLDTLDSDLDDGAGDESLVLNGSLNLAGDKKDALNGVDHEGKKDEDGEGTDRKDDEDGDEIADSEDSNDAENGKEYVNRINDEWDKSDIMTRYIKFLLLIKIFIFI